MYLYLISILFFLVANYLITTLIKRYTFVKFFIYVMFYFVPINFINLIYLQNVNFFSFQVLFSITVLFLYTTLYRAVSVKVMIYLYLKKQSISVNDFYKKEFKEKSFNKRINILIDNKLIMQKNKIFSLSSKGEKYLKIIKICHSIYGIKSSG